LLLNFKKDKDSKEGILILWKKYIQYFLPYSDENPENSKILNLEKKLYMTFFNDLRVKDLFCLLP